MIGGHLYRPGSGVLKDKTKAGPKQAYLPSKPSKGTPRREQASDRRGAQKSSTSPSSDKPQGYTGGSGGGAPGGRPPGKGPPGGNGGGGGDDDHHEDDDEDNEDDSGIHEDDRDKGDRSPRSPRGEKVDKGDKGDKGDRGDPGIQGPPGAQVGAGGVPIVTPNLDTTNLEQSFNGLSKSIQDIMEAQHDVSSSMQSIQAEYVNAVKELTQTTQQGNFNTIFNDITRYDGLDKDELENWIDQIQLA